MEEGRNISFYIEHEVTGVDITCHIFSHCVMVSAEGAGECCRHLGVIAVFKSFFGGIGFEAPYCSAVLGGKSWDIQEPFLPDIL